ncbi:MAG: bifunctional phosphoribosylaminoimidazolecarboxamide formyltransferase/IMP cyclohydrolase [Candidatus Omnitrophica bacterium]|nr:bifunctional phosphoribosylaminoimidazolecarboxamide formyltransferase/IMP cyclohydrolase [Candidatus Omnitrophota bacterium]
MVKITRALISVSDKTGIVELCQELKKWGVEILSTGGTAKLLRENNITVQEVCEYTGFPEMLDGRVKTLHPKIHGGLLALRENLQHLQSLKDQGIGLIDMVVVNLYPFEKTIEKPGVAIEEAIENIDIGGPSMLRSAAKNYRWVCVLSNPSQYPGVIGELRKYSGSVSQELMRDLATEVFARTSHYDGAINRYLKSTIRSKEGAPADTWPAELNLRFEKMQELRYGENPHQKAALYREKGNTKGLVNLIQLQGKELSFNNILDLHSAWELVKEFGCPAAAIIKHNNPCGVAQDGTLKKAYYHAWKSDELSSFGGIVALNREADLEVATLILKSGFRECIIAPQYQPAALDLFKTKKNLRVLLLHELEPVDELEFKRVGAGLLLQAKDTACLAQEGLKIPTKKKPTKKQLESLIFGWKVAKHVKSNAIVLTQATKTVGIGAGQMSRVDSVFIARHKAGARAKNSCLASDGFFPKPDAVREASRAGAKAIIQPGGSIADDEIIKACDRYGIAMVFTGIRHFKH